MTCESKIYAKEPFQRNGSYLALTLELTSMEMLGVEGDKDEVVCIWVPRMNKLWPFPTFQHRKNVLCSYFLNSFGGCVNSYANIA